MKVVALSETYAPGMGYLTTMLPRALARAGADVHLIVLDLPVYHYLPDFEKTYGSFLSGAPVAGRVIQRDGYHVHVLRHAPLLGFPRAIGLQDKLAELRPDVVYTSVAVGWLPLQAALGRLRLGYRLFTGSHTAASMFPLANRPRPWLTAAGLRSFATRWTSGRLVSWLTELCYAPTDDCGEIAWRFFGVQKHKVRVVHLGVDTEEFCPPRDDGDRAARATFRSQLGFGPEDVVCVYSGKMTEAKNALILAQAIGKLRQRGLPFRGLFIGNGVQCERIAATQACAVVDFMPYHELADYYRASDIGVWPTTESISMLDAAACALPLVVSDRIYRDHVDGNGFVYRENDLDELVRVLADLADANLRARLGAAGAAKMVERFNWRTIALNRLRDFSQAIGAGQAA